MNKTNFTKAFDNLKGHERRVVKEVIIRTCKLKSPVSFYQKKNGDRQISERSEKGVNEIQIIENTFKAFNVNAWTGEKI